MGEWSFGRHTSHDPGRSKVTPDAPSCTTALVLGGSDTSTGADADWFGSDGARFVGSGEGVAAQAPTSTASSPTQTARPITTRYSTARRGIRFQPERVTFPNTEPGRQTSVTANDAEPSATN